MKNITRDKIIEAAKKAAKQVDGPLQRRDFERITGINNYHIYKLFPEGGWLEVMQLAGLESLHPKPDISLSRESIIEAAKEASKQVSGPLTRSEFKRITGINDYYIHKFFPEDRWSELKQLARLERHPGHMIKISDEELLREYHRIASDIGDIPPWHVFTARANVSASSMTHRFGGSKGTVKKYIDWLKVNHPDSPLLDRIRSKEKSLPIIKEPASSQNYPEWGRTRGPQFGEPIDFRGLRHAPINEQGVVFLFGVVSYELGFIVEAVHASYPDCEAKMCIDRQRGRWQRVRIEFEYKSSNFRDHGHNPQECNLIVCWEHDWADCPIEVIELKKVIKELPKEVRYA